MSLPGTARAILAARPTRKVITMCHFKRPAYSRQVLDALRACAGIEDYLILPHVEPGNEEVRAAIEAIDFAECLPTWNGGRLGVERNTENALLDGFSFAEFVIHLEDDIVCAADALRYYEWCRVRFADDPTVFSATGFNRRREPVPERESHLVRRRRWFHPCGWATWTDRWEQFSGRLSFGPKSWDAELNSLFCNEESALRRSEVYPELSRSQHIGLVSSIHNLPPEFYRETYYLEHWAGARPVAAGAFHE